MKRADIMPGEVYAFQDSKYSSLKECVFLTPLTRAHLYQGVRRRAPGQPRFKRDGTAARPYKGYVYGDTGYLAAIGSNVLGASLEEALSPDGSREERSYSYQILISTTKVIGIYTQVALSRQEAEDRERAALAVRHAENEAVSHAHLLLQTKLLSWGIDIDLLGSTGTWRDSERNRKDSPPRAFVMTFDQAQELDKLLSALSHGIHINYREG